MALTTLSGTVSSSVNATGTQVFTENSTPTGNVSDSLAISLAMGTGAAQGNNIWSDQRQLAISTGESLGLGSGHAGVALYPMFSAPAAATAAMAFTKVHTIFIRNLSTVADISVGGGVGATDWAALIVTDGDAIKIRPGGSLMLSCGSTDSTQYAVAAAEILYILNNSAAAVATYSITIIGTTSA